MKESVLKRPIQAFAEKKNHDLHPKGRVLLREELAALTKNHEHAIILSQLLYWTQRTKDFHLMLKEESERSGRKNNSPQYGWIYKTAKDLIEETTLQVDRTTIRRYLRCLVTKEWIQTRTNPQSKWIRTIQYRVNVTKIHHDLMALGHHLSELSLWGLEDAFLREENSKGQNARSKGQNAPSKEQVLLDVVEVLNGPNIPSDAYLAPSEEQLPAKTAENSNGHFALSNGRFAHSNGYIAPSNEHNAHSNTETTTKTTSEITNREHTHRTRAREAVEKNVDLKKSDDWKSLGSLTSFAVSEASEALDPSASASLSQILEQMAEAWKIHVGQEVHLTLERKNGLQFVLKAYFQNDLSQWAQFCKRVSHLPFLMGKGPRKWRVSLDWVLVEENLLKVLEGNFDDPASLDQKRVELSKTSKEQEIHSVLASIADPVWKEWCSQLDFSLESRDPVSLGELKTIANARFLEIEDDRLVWIESSDRKTLSCIEDLKFKILPVVQRAFPQARTLRTRLCPDLIGAKAG